MTNAKIKITILSAILVTFFSAHQAAAMAKPPISDTPTTTPKPTPTPTPKPSPTPSPTPSEPTTGRQVTPLWESAHADGKKWTDYVDAQLEVLGQDLLDVKPADATTFCPKYNSLSYQERKEFWTYLMSQMVKYESNFKPATAYTESFNDSKGNRVVSRGLLQLSIESGNAYGCGFKSASEVHDPYKNLACGIRILNRWMERDGRIAGKVSGSWKGGARYWSVLRSTNSPYAKITAGTKAISICK
ncbi:transglycosylase SLT domain-containing protein [Bdellovibrio sp. HCB288]|uniref:transglycosylase SLT domain-containing protein n=1 Tax=Bdellovibrio sp. HCB288 TaxID=3394355 RepID=UPI0039B629F9